MTPAGNVFSGPGRLLVADAPEGQDARLLAATAREQGRVMLIARDDARLARLAELLAFFAPELEVIRFPAWDCLPYDRVGPHRDIVAQRLDAMTRLMAENGTETPRVVLTTVNAALQRIPPRQAFEGRLLRLSPGAAVSPDALVVFLVDNGYLRVETVGEAGEYALRGGLVDVFAPGDPTPLRLDFFGDEIESIRAFDPLSQRSSGSRGEAVLKPVSEIILDDASIARFRTGYREYFGTSKDGDPLYEAVSAGRSYAGQEHWLPLFYEEMETLFDLVGGAPILLDHQAEEVRGARLETIADFYEARQMTREAGSEGGYHPLPAERLYLSAEDWGRGLEGRAVGQLSPFAAPPEAEGVVSAGGRSGQDFAEARTKGGEGLYDAVRAYVGAEQGKGRRVLVGGFSDGSRDRLGTLLREHGLAGLETVGSWAEAAALVPESVALVTLGVERGFRAEDATLLTEQDILGERIARPARRARRPENFLTEVSSLQESDLVVHVEHGIGRYEGLMALDVGGAPHDCLKVIYQGGDRLFVPVENIEVLSRYGSEETAVDLDRLGHGGWQARKARVKQRVKDIADQLIKIAAARELKEGEVLNPPEGLYEEFCARFPYPETDDQLDAIADTLEDLGSGRPMDRLICGDVGFGKTEIALRAAFVTAMTGLQVAVVVPTTLLARQHSRNFKERFAGLPLNIGQLSRLVPPAETAATKAGIEDGSVDIVIGTHALLAKSISFKRLGLLIVDEEQHFGVKQKERLKQLRADVHVLTLTATPIPRTLQLAMSGVRDMSLIATPPVDRLAVRTFVLPYDPVIVREAILREHFRGGQVFYVCPRIEDLPELEERLQKLVPEIKVGVAHGQLAAGALEAVMTAFYDGRYDVLLSTNIVESGLDIPTANTLILHRADMFGLAQLYQLRGRIGRSKLRGYAYFTLKPGRLLTPAAERRLDVMQTLDTLGAGFTLASHDLDIRGAGNLLGEEQSGHIREVGIELYQAMLEEAVATARGQAGEAVEAEAWTPQISLGTSVLIPEAYVRDLNVRLGLYRRLSTLVGQSEIDAFAAELVDRFGPMPEEVENLLNVIAIKQLCREANVAKLDAGPKGAVIAFHNDEFANPAALVAFIGAQAGLVKLRPDQRLVYRRNWETAQARLEGARRLLNDLAKVAKEAA